MIILQHITLLFILFLTFIASLFMVFYGEFLIYDQTLKLFCGFIYLLKKEGDIYLPPFYNKIYLKNQHLIDDDFKKSLDEIY